MRLKNRTSGGSILSAVLLTGVAVAGAASINGCSDPTTTTTTSSGSASSSGEAGAGGASVSSSSSSSSSSSGTAGMGGTGGVGGMGGTGGAGGSGPTFCATTATGPTRGSAIAISPDDKHLVSVNRDVGTVTITSVDNSGAQPVMTKVAELSVGTASSEPWQVAMDGCGDRAYVVLRKDQKVVVIDGVSTATPTVGASVAVGSEPTGLALSPNNKTLYVTNWVNGTVSVIDAATMTVTSTVDLNATLAASNLLGTVTARAALAHPRAIAITNNGDANDTDEHIYVTEWFAQRTGPETVATADTNKKGVVYSIKASDGTASIIDLPPVMDTGFPDHNGGVTGCFPNQVGSITINGAFAYVTSTCASPKGPIGVFAGKNAGGLCTVATQAADCGMVGGVCDTVSLKCQPNTTDVKTTTHPALTIIDLTTEVASGTTALDKNFTDKMSTRMPLLPTDIAFFNTFGYLSSLGADGVFRLVTTNGLLTDVGSATNKFIDMRTDAMDKLLRTPIGIATGHTGNAVAFVANEGSRDVTAVALNTQSIAGMAGNYSILQASALPATGTPEDAILRGKRFFNTGLGRWSLSGASWGSCAACHIDGLSDNISWYFARGPRQSVSLDGSFASNDPTDQRVFNWTAIFDEVADFEGNTRNISGGKGAIVDGTDARIDTAAQTPPQQGLQGSSTDIADPLSANMAHPHSALNDWNEIAAYIKSIRSPRKPTNLVAADVSAGRTLFTGAGAANCVGCHSGAKWTISKRFYTPGDIPNAATASMVATSLGNISWNIALNGFPAALFPIGGAAVPMTDARMRFGAPPGAEQIQCILRPVGTGPTGTTGVGPAAVGVLELRQDMTTAGQGSADTGRGFNPPSLLGIQVGAPYFHAGNARTLEELFDDTLFKNHHSSAIAQVFAIDATTRAQLVAFLLSIDESEPTVAIPAKSANGGDICFYP